MGRQWPAVGSEALTTTVLGAAACWRKSSEGGRYYPYHSLASLKDELPRSVGDQYATGEDWRNNSRKEEETEPK